MSKSMNDALEEWDLLLQSVRETEGDLAGVAPFREALARSKAQVRTFRSLRDTLKVSTGDASHRLRSALGTGEDAAVSLRSFIRGALGPRSEKLHRYGMKPLGGRRRGCAP